MELPGASAGPQLLSIPARTAWTAAAYDCEQRTRASPGPAKGCYSQHWLRSRRVRAPAERRNACVKNFFKKMQSRPILIHWVLNEPPLTQPAPTPPPHTKPALNLRHAPCCPSLLRLEHRCVRRSPAALVSGVRLDPCAAPRSARANLPAVSIEAMELACAGEAPRPISELLHTS